MKAVLQNVSPDPVTGAVPLTAESSARLLTSIIEDCDQKLVCFDLDSTLIDNRPRNAAIMREFANVSGDEPLLQARAKHFPTWSASNSMLLLGLTASRTEQLVNPYMAFWESRFFTGEYCTHDVAVDGAVQFANSIQAAGGHIYYVTGRDESMRAGTVASLEKLGFPSPAREVQLKMNPTREGSDDEYKRRTLLEIAERSELVAAFDNEPTHINAYRSAFSKAHCVHLHKDHSMRDVRLLDGIVSIMDFQH